MDSISAEHFLDSHGEAIRFEAAPGAKAQRRRSCVLVSINPAICTGGPVPPRQWLVPNWIPMARATSLYGGGGKGKPYLPNACDGASLASTSPPTIKIPTLLSRSDVLSTEPSLMPGSPIVAKGLPGSRRGTANEQRRSQRAKRQAKLERQRSEMAERAAKRREAASGSNPSAVRRPIRQPPRGFDLIKASF
jgi:hypothetical protein